MDVVARVVWWIELYNPINLGNIQTASGDVGAKKDTSRRIAKFKESICPFLLLLFTLVTMSDTQVQNYQQKEYSHAGRKQERRCNLGVPRGT